MLTSTQRRSKASSDANGRIARRASAGVAALCVLLAAPTLALAGGTNYFGPIDQPGNTESPSVYLKVGTKDKKPIELRRFAVYEPATQPCSGSDGVHFPQVKFPQELLPLPITKRSFSGRAEAPDGDFFEISGVVPRKGPARGTVQLTTTVGNGERCDTGVLSWEAPVYENPY
jgi:hypothetical protein